MNAVAPPPALDTVILDLDGTLVDTVYQHVLAWRSAFLGVGVDIPAWRIHRAIGMGGDRLVAAVAGRAVENAVGDEVRKLHGLRFEDLVPHVTPTNGAPELLEALRNRDLKVVVASSGEREVTERLLSVLGAAEGSSGAIAVALGPEGGWSDDEVARFAAAGWARVSLGGQVLRAETAAIAALAVIGAWQAARGA